MPVARIQPDVFEIPDDSRPFHRPNPYWVDPALRGRSSSPTDSFEAEGSVTSTILDDDQVSIKTSEDDDEPLDDESEDVIDMALGTSIALASIFSTPKEDIADVRRAANEAGLHMALMRRPGSRQDGKSTINKRGQRENSWWVAIGKNAEAVRHLADSQEQGMPGHYEPREDYPSSGTSIASSFFQMIIAGAIGGAAVIFGMTRMLH